MSDIVNRGASMPSSESIIYNLIKLLAESFSETRWYYSKPSDMYKFVMDNGMFVVIKREEVCLYSVIGNKLIDFKNSFLIAKDEEALEIYSIFDSKRGK